MKSHDCYWLSSLSTWISNHFIGRHSNAGTSTMPSPLPQRNGSSTSTTTESLGHHQSLFVLTEIDEFSGCTTSWFGQDSFPKSSKSENCWKIYNPWETKCIHGVKRYETLVHTCSNQVMAIESTVQGNFHGTWTYPPGAGDWTLSDRRLKKEIKPLRRTLQGLQARSSEMSEGQL